MDKKTLIGLGLAFATGGAALIVLLGFKFVSNMKVKKERRQLKKYVKKHFKNNPRLLAGVDGLSNFEVKIIFKVINKATEKIADIKLPNSVNDKISAIVAG